MKNFQHKFSTAAILSLTLLLGACSDDDDDEEMMVEPDPTPMPVNVSYEVSVTNLTYGQPMSPIGVALHSEGQLWMVGESASAELEQMAEGGDNSAAGRAFAAPARLHGHHPCDCVEAASYAAAALFTRSKRGFTVGTHCSHRRTTLSELAKK